MHVGTSCCAGWYASEMILPVNPLDSTNDEKERFISLRIIHLQP